MEHVEDLNDIVDQAIDDTYTTAINGLKGRFERFLQQDYKLVQAKKANIYAAASSSRTKRKGGGLLKFSKKSNHAARDAIQERQTARAVSRLQVRERGREGGGGGGMEGRPHLLLFRFDAPPPNLYGSYA